ncbi:MAG: hypothetical protein AAFQ83_19785 [Bacteroidota bacterium]
MAVSNKLISMGDSRRWTAYVHTFIWVWSIGFILTFAFPYTFLPDVGTWIGQVFIPVNKLWGKGLGLDGLVFYRIQSDTLGLYLHMLTLTLYAAVVSIWGKRIYSPQRAIIYSSALSYYLSLTLLLYGLDKVFKSQFPFPEPNLLFTNLGALTPDILYWSTIGSSYPYSLFTGLLEVIPAILLLFRPTRLVGWILGALVMLQVVAINFSYDINVKVYSLFLLGSFVYLLQPHLQSLGAFLRGKPAQLYFPPAFIPKNQRQVYLYTLAKTGIILLLFVESLGPHLAAGYLNYDEKPKPALHGTYEILEDPTLKRCHVHSRGYFLLEYTDERFESYRLTYDDLLAILYVEGKGELQYEMMGDTLSLKGEWLKLRGIKQDLEQLPLKQPHFHWTLESMVDQP